MTRDIAVKFNEAYGETFVIPEQQVKGETAKVPGLDGEKMSKSYGNTLEIFGEEKPLQKKVMSIKMDSRTPTEPKPDADMNLAVQLLKLVEIKSFSEAVEDKLRNGQIGYGDLKKQLFKSYWEYFTEARKKRAELAANLDYVNSVLADGASKARTLAQKVLHRARKNCGLE
jgi:tryptophanyl-tRNA synthetase